MYKIEGISLDVRKSRISVGVISYSHNLVVLKDIKLKLMYLLTPKNIFKTARLKDI